MIRGAHNDAVVLHEIYILSARHRDDRSYVSASFFDH